VRNPQRLLALIALAVLPTFTVACGGGADQTVSPPTTEATADAPTTVAQEARYTVATASKNGTVQIYKAPDEAQKASTLKNPRLINDDPNAKVPLVMLVEDQQGDWLKVSLPVRPNGSTGWVKKSDFNLTDHDYRMEIALSDFNLKAFRGDEQIFDAKIGVAMDNTPTPNGTYYTTELLEPPDPKGAYGPYAIGLSGHSDVLTTFDGGPGQLGIHGTNEPQNIGKKISHGCIRLKNEDVTKLVDIGMPLGTPVIIKA
jgi:lipoprotein-anchoring transpeptidase ErfK/SrfK